MNPGFLSDKRAIIALIIAIPLAIIAIVFVRPIDFNLSLGIFGVALILFLFTCLLDTADEMQPTSAMTSTLKVEKKTEPADEHAEVYVPEVIKTVKDPSKLPIETIEGIGLVFGKLLRDAGYPTVADMVAVDAGRIAEICDINVEHAERWIAMSRFAWLDDISEEDAEAIVFATGIEDLETLAGASAEDINNKIKVALESGEIRVPAGYTFTLEKIMKWIAAAKALAKFQ
jgi:hypothetical protein